MGRADVPHQAQEGLHLSHPLLVDGSPPRALRQIALCKLACPEPHNNYCYWLLERTDGRVDDATVM